MPLHTNFVGCFYAKQRMDDGDNHRSGYILNTSGILLGDLKLLQVAFARELGSIYFYSQ